MQWLADSIARHLATWASRGHRKQAECFSFEGLNEASIAVILDRIYTGMGFLTWPECRGYEGTNQRADLYAEAPNGKQSYLIEAKTVGDGGDNRLNRNRFFTQREHLSDFERLTEAKGYDFKVMVWIAWSSSEEVVTAGEDAKTMRLGDALSAVKGEFPGASLQGKALIPFEQYAECTTSKFGHVFCWIVK